MTSAILATISITCAVVQHDEHVLGLEQFDQGIERGRLGLLTKLQHADDVEGTCGIAHRCELDEPDTLAAPVESSPRLAARRVLLSSAP